MINSETCPVCGIQNFVPLGQIKINSTALPKISSQFRNLIKCTDCGTISIIPKPTEKELQEYYEKYFIELQNQNGETNWKKRTALESIISIAQKLKKGKVLDIGCADGSLLKSLGQTFTKYGIELSEEACRKAKENGINVYCSSFMQAEFHTKYDLIIALDILEHLDDPKAALLKMAEILEPGGYIIIQTGNADSAIVRFLGEDWAYMSIFGHLQALTPKAISKTIADKNIDEISISYSSHIKKGALIFLFHYTCACCFHIFKIICKKLPKIIFKIPSIKKIYNHKPLGSYICDHFTYIGKKTVKDSANNGNN
jgi:2-polyprenyl-3-methyl-5-hydroxy-6-metoxy-1,4-benzoquinol methylase